MAYLLQDVVKGQCEDTVTLIWVMYTNGTSEIVEWKRLEDLLAGNGIAEFYRPSELRWVTLGSDRVRGDGGSYAGPERRCAS